MDNGELGAMRVIIAGAGGHGRVVAWIARAVGTHELVGFVDEAGTGPDERILGLPLLGDVSALGSLRRRGVEAALLGKGDNNDRARWAQSLRESGFQLLRIVHPTALVHESAELGDGVVVAAGAIVCPEVHIGQGAIINTGAIVEHNCRVGDFAHVAPGTRMAGRVRVGDFTFIGVGSSIRDNISIGSGVTVGAGSVVVSDVPDGITVVGVPAGPLARGTS